MTEYNQIEHIRELVNQRRSVPDEVILEELAALPVLPDQEDSAWDEEQTWREHADVYLALAKVAVERKLRAALPLLLERTSYGDPFEIMRGLRHKLEGIVEKDWALLADVCTQAVSYPQSGARLWAITELGILRDRSTIEAVISALDDSALEVRIAACRSLEMICQTNGECRQPAIKALTEFLSRQRSSGELQAGQRALRNITDAE